MDVRGPLRGPLPHSSRSQRTESVLYTPFGKSIFAENLPLQTFRATVANVDTESLKSRHTLFDTYLDHMMAKFEPNRFV